MFELLRAAYGFCDEERRRPRTPIHPTSGFQHKSKGRAGSSDNQAFRKRVAKRRAKKGYA